MAVGVGVAVKVSPWVAVTVAASLTGVATGVEMGVVAVTVKGIVSTTGVGRGSCDCRGHHFFYQVEAGQGQQIHLFLGHPIIGQHD
ncbi:hypothetical protein RY27_13250 [Litorilinea aerophila]|nr:hypothetical protein RY27_13250 [Litorilinea aerophila]